MIFFSIGKLTKKGILMAIYCINTDWRARDDVITCNLWFDKNMAFAGDYEGDEGVHARFFRKLKVDDLILMYHDKGAPRNHKMKGVVAIGMVYEKWDRKCYQADGRLLYRIDRMGRDVMFEYRIGVRWLLDWRESPGKIDIQAPRWWYEIKEDKYPQIYRQVKELVEAFDEEALTNSIRAVDLFEPPQRIKSEVTRIIRDTAQTQLLKRLHEYKCQLCGMVIQLPDGSRYNEAHHIKPLGRGHDGPDVAKNIIVVCPNHHAMLDLGAIKLTIGDISIGHEIGLEFIEYHNTMIYKAGS